MSSKYVGGFGSGPVTVATYDNLISSISIGLDTFAAEVFSIIFSRVDFFILSIIVAYLGSYAPIASPNTLVSGKRRKAIWSSNDRFWSL